MVNEKRYPGYYLIYDSYSIPFEQRLSYANSKELSRRGSKMVKTFERSSEPWPTGIRKKIEVINYASESSYTKTITEFWPNGSLKLEYKLQNGDSTLIKKTSPSGLLVYSQNDTFKHEDKYTDKSYIIDTNIHGEPVLRSETKTTYYWYYTDSIQQKNTQHILYGYDNEGRLTSESIINDFDTFLKTSYQNGSRGNVLRTDFTRDFETLKSHKKSSIEFDNQKRPIYSSQWSWHPDGEDYLSREIKAIYNGNVFKGYAILSQDAVTNHLLSQKLWTVITMSNLAARSLNTAEELELQKKLTSRERTYYSEYKIIGFDAFYKKYGLALKKSKYEMRIEGDTFTRMSFEYKDSSWQLLNSEKRLKTWQSRENFEKMLFLESVIQTENNLIVETWNYNNDLASTFHSKQIGADSNNLQTTLTEEWSYGQLKVPRKHCEYQINRTIIRFNETRVPDSAYKAARINNYDQLILPVNNYTKRELINGKLLVVEKATRNYTTQEYLHRTLNSITWERFSMNSTTHLLELNEKCKLTERSYIPNPSGYTFQVDEEYYEKESKQLVMHKTTGHSYNNRNQPTQIHEVYFVPYSKETSHTQTSEYQYNTNGDIILKKEPVFGNPVTVVWEYEYY
ncbi:MAG: hypothetical protein KDC92_15430 [Bacteroidetes bacterium]|nr:hypothetical protein [Bacteroidota bacterium]